MGITLLDVLREIAHSEIVRIVERHPDDNTVWLAVHFKNGPDGLYHVAQGVGPTNEDALRELQRSIRRHLSGEVYGAANDDLPF